MFTRHWYDRTACVLATTLCFLGLTGCGGGGSGQPTFGGPDPTALSASATTPNGLTATVAQEKASTSTGAPLTYTLTLANPTSLAVTVQAVGGLDAQGGYDLSKVQPDVSFQIADTSGKLVYPDPTVPHPNAAIAPVPITLPAGQAISVRIAIPGGLSPSGRYQANATFLISGQGTTSEVDAPVGPLIVSVH